MNLAVRDMLDKASSGVASARDMLRSLPGPLYFPIKALLAVLLAYNVLRVIRWAIFREKSTPLQLIDFAVYHPPEKNECSSTELLRIARDKYSFDGTSTTFMRRIHPNTGLSSRVAIPDNLRAGKYTIEDARDEARTVMFGAVDELLARTKVRPAEIGVVVTNCSLFCPTPSLASIIINHYKMGPETSAYAMGGQGCGAGPCAVDLVWSQLLKYRHAKYGLLVSTENMTQNFYKGSDRSMLLPNVLFRMGASACLFSLRGRGKYTCHQLLKTHCGADDGAYKCVYQTIDELGNTGVALYKTVSKYAYKVLIRNMTRLFLRILPVSELLRYGTTEFCAKPAIYWFKTHVLKHPTKKQLPELPRIKKAVDLFCFHTGGRGVLDGMQMMFKLDEHEMAASRASLYRYGNVSSASIWYELAYHEQHGHVARGARVWQIAFGSGFKCNSIIWKANRAVTEKNCSKFDLISDWKWEDVIGVKDEITPEEAARDYIKEDEELAYKREEQEFAAFCKRFADRIEPKVKMGEKDVKQEINIQ